jgi:hypothetical protein
MRVKHLIEILQTRDPSAEVVLVDVQDARCVRELHVSDIHDLTLYRPHPDRALRHEPRGPAVNAVCLGELLRT